MRWVMYRRPPAGVFEFRFKWVCETREQKNAFFDLAGMARVERISTLAQAGLPVLLKGNNAPKEPHRLMVQDRSVVASGTACRAPTVLSPN